MNGNDIFQELGFKCDESGLTKFGAMPNRDTHINLWQSRVGFWHRAIGAELAARKTLLGNLPRWLGAFRVEFESGDFYTPMCLAQVVDELARRGVLVPRRRFKAASVDVQRRAESGWGSWLFNTLVQRPASASWESIVSSSGSDSNSNSHLHSMYGACDDPLCRDVASMHCCFVDVAAANAAAERYFDSLGGQFLYLSDRLVPIAQFFRSAGDVLSFGERDCDVLLDALARRRMAARVYDHSGNGDSALVGVKFAERAGANAAPVDRNVDRGILAIKSTLDELQQQQARTRADIDLCTERAAEQLRAKQRKRALGHLRRRKMLADALDKRIDAADKLGDVLMSIQQADTDTALLAAYRHGASAIRGVQAGTSVGQIDSVVDELAELMADQRDIDDALATASLGDDANDEALDAELAALVAGSSSPSSSPSASSDSIEELLGQLSLAPTHVSIAMQSSSSEAASSSSSTTHAEKEKEPALAM
jgi:Snf7